VYLTFTVGEVANQEDSSFPIDLHFAVARLGISTLTDGPQFVRYLVYDFLRERVENDGPVPGTKSYSWLGRRSRHTIACKADR